MNKSFLTLLCVVLLAGCKGTQKVEPTEKFSARPFSGSYVSDGYEQRAQGYDWVGVSVGVLNDSTATIAVRSRGDRKKPTCRFDGQAVVLGKDTLKCTYDGKDILFVRTDSTLTISTAAEADSGLLYYFCSGGATMGGTYKKIVGDLDSSQVDK